MRIMIGITLVWLGIIVVWITWVRLIVGRDERRWPRGKDYRGVEYVDEIPNANTTAAIKEVKADIDRTTSLPEYDSVDDLFEVLDKEHDR